MQPQLFGEVGRAGRGVSRLAEGEPFPADPDGLDSHREAPARTPATADVVVDQPESDARRSRAARRRPFPQLGVGEPRPERGAECRRIVGRNQHPGPDPVGAVTEGLGHPADIGCDDR